MWYHKNKKTKQKIKAKRKKIINREKKTLVESRTWTIYTEGRLLDHCATLSRIMLMGKFLYRELKDIFKEN